MRVKIAQKKTEERELVDSLLGWFAGGEDIEDDSAGCPANAVPFPVLSPAGTNRRPWVIEKLPGGEKVAQEGKKDSRQRT